jgi:putative tRNA adenosine deaminase-associated protein
VSYFAAALARTRAGWTAEELDLDGLTDVDAVADRVRDVDGEAETALLFVEEDDEYVAILRVDADDLRVFVSDPQAAETYPVAGIFAGAVEEEPPRRPTWTTTRKRRGRPARLGAGRRRRPAGRPRYAAAGPDRPGHARAHAAVRRDQRGLRTSRLPRRARDPPRA